MLVVLALTVADFSSKLLNLHRGCTADILCIALCPNSFSCQQGQDGSSTIPHFAEGSSQHKETLLSVTSPGDFGLPFPNVPAPDGN